MPDGIRDSGFGIRSESRTQIPNPKSRIPALTIATVFGIGYLPIAPGTFGSAVGLLVWAVVPQTAAAQGAAIAVLFAIGCWSGSVAEHHFGRIDPGQVVIDEVMGMLITLFLNPVGWAGALVGFVVFRVADIVKPYPSNRLERLPGGVGVMADDGMAAIYANLGLRAMLAIGNRVIG